jgi:hypothetical protein
MRNTLTTMAVLFFSTSCVALPNSPTPKVEAPKVTHAHFWDHTNKAEFAVMSVAAAFDMGQTCYFLSHGEREYVLTQSCGKNVAITASLVGLAAGSAWLLNRSGHRKLARIPMLIMAGNSANGLARSKRAGGW